MAGRLKAIGAPKYRNGFAVTIHEDTLELPMKWKQPRLVFVNSMGDLFHEKVPFEFIRKVFDVMSSCPKHVFQVLTKRSERLRRLASSLPWPENVWMGVTVEDSTTVWRVQDLQSVPAAVRFLSCEPLLGAIENLPLDGIHWVIVGGESGPFARPMRAVWVESIQNQCLRAETAFFFKQWGGVRKHLTGRMLHGRTYDDMPPLPDLSLNVRQPLLIQA
jgi:protein gp37